MTCKRYAFLPKTMKLAETSNAKSLAIPIFGVGTDVLSKSEVLDLFNNTYKGAIEVFVYEYKQED